jgi:RNA polymerase sigma-70 factor (ECF subfamily)
MNTLLENSLENATVAELVLAAQRGERAAFGALFERFERHVYGIAVRRLRHHDEAEELCQDVFVQAMAKIRQLRAPECFAGWLRSITRRMAINRILRRGPTQSVDPSTLDAACVELRTPLMEALAGERGVQLKEGLSRLGALDRRTLVAFYVKGRSLLEMSAEFHAPLGTIKRRLHVARKRLAKEVGQRVALSS